ncbi:MAG: hypothetical protein UT48_C0010G0077 [Parcubacteria group bacterium GW2011_GWE2_39_37]|uniref:SCP domain-containing protein n=1 Tax=Candidatus Falkowbacteria bacterium GW2011_GWF2_39_8 TaxID=1618642 RepID=A0A0G0PTH6_9BACT|nr:MAG: hypothetical protein UT48_C0010G0077 [Parcubacteria group bacterium GW2011_GWE2_39_37]KKR31484.1 MAG: hypothetical protein UT64_C0059G0007 [Candidatus Falkowbacteria bacterium GW2011_GWF2_39_8]
MKKLFLFFSVILVLWIFFGNGLEKIISKYDVELPPLEKISEKIKVAERQILAPPPLIGKENFEDSFLSDQGVLEWTNTAREKNQLSRLKRNEKLAGAALNKANDILANQYFEHISPAGKGPADLAQAVSYQYIVIGENLALGNFKDDEELVMAWMQSPGHRANILNSKYAEIGIAVVKGDFNGKQTWVAVQEFGLPLSSCPEPDIALKTVLDGKIQQANKLEQELILIKAQIDKPSTKFSSKHQGLVDKYNTMVGSYNKLLPEIKNLTNRYNLEVDKFNQCIKT